MGRRRRLILQPERMPFDYLLLPGGWAKSGQTLVVTSTFNRITGRDEDLATLVPIENATYLCRATCTTATSGSFRFSIDQTVGASRSTVGVFEELIVAGSTTADVSSDGKFTLSGLPFTGVIKDVSVRLVELP